MILDRGSRRGVGRAAGGTQATGTLRAALRLALAPRPPPRGLLDHSDREGQYARAEHRAVLQAAGLTPSMSRQANPDDNAVMESFFATYKRECVALAQPAGGYAIRTGARADCFAYVESYY